MEVRYFIIGSDDNPAAVEPLFESTDKDATIDWFKNKNLDDYQVVLHWQDANEVYFDAQLNAREWMLEELRKEILLALENATIIDD